MFERKLASFEYRLMPRPKYLLVWHKGSPTLAGMLDLQQEILAEMAARQVRRLLLDTREIDSVSEELRNHMAHWLTVPGRFEAVANLAHSSMIAVRATMNGYSAGVPRRGFTSFDEADAWLNAYEPPSPKPARK